tara:strand:+ start:1580 stop:1969 length:390 start_codon:yes stop_codon:yes gene_type:complete
MTEEKQMEVWSIEELIAMTDTVQSKDIEWQGKILSIQYCELTEEEEPKMLLPDDDMPTEEQNDYYREIASQRVARMISKANEKNPEGITLSDDNWGKMPTTLRWQISGTVLGTSATEGEGPTTKDFQDG